MKSIKDGVNCNGTNFEPNLMKIHDLFHSYWRAGHVDMMIPQACLFLLAEMKDLRHRATYVCERSCLGPTRHIN